MNSAPKPFPAKPGALRRDIAIAISIKVLLLVALWFLMFRWNGSVKPPEAEHMFATFAPPAPATDLTPSPSPSNTKEPTHVR